MKKNVIDFLVLSKSIKYYGFCVVGLNLVTKELIRIIPRSNSINSAIDCRSLNYIKNGELKEVEVFDVVQIRYIKIDNPLFIQLENKKVDDTYVKYIGSYTKEIMKVIDNKKANIFGNRLPYLTKEEAMKAKHSIEVVSVKSVYIDCNKANFIYRGKEYKNVSVTDKNYRDSNEPFFFSKAWLILSLSNKAYVDGNFYKFIVTIIEK